MRGKLRAVVVGWCDRRGAPSLSAGFGRAQPSKDRGVQALVADGVSGMRAMRPRARRNTLARDVSTRGVSSGHCTCPGSSTSRMPCVVLQVVGFTVAPDCRVVRLRLTGRLLGARILRASTRLPGQPWCTSCCLSWGVACRKRPNSAGHVSSSPPAYASSTESLSCAGKTRKARRTAHQRRRGSAHRCRSSAGPATRYPSRGASSAS